MAPASAHGVDHVVDVAQPGDVVAPVGHLGRAADDAADPEAELGVVADEAVEVEALLVGADDDDRAAVAAGPAVGLEPGPVPVAGGGEEGEAEGGAADDLVEGEVDAEAPLTGLEEEGGEDGGAAQPDRLHGPDAAHPGQVEALGGDHGQGGGGGEDHGQDEVRECGPTPAAGRARRAPPARSHQAATTAVASSTTRMRRSDCDPRPAVPRVGVGDVSSVGVSTAGASRRECCVADATQSPP